MRAREFIIEVSLPNVARTPLKGGVTVGQEVAARYKKQSGNQVDELEALEMLAQADPTPANNYTKWLAKIYISGNSNFRIPEDLAQVKTDLGKFMKLSKTGKLPTEQRDLNKYQTLSQIYDVIEQFPDDEMQSNREKKQAVKAEGADVIIREPGFVVIHTKTHEANCHYGAGTKWCTASKDEPDYFDQYSEQGPLYTIIADDKKYQFHYESDQFLNARDEEVEQSDIALLSKHPGWAKFLNMQIKEHYGKYFEEA